MITPAQHNFIIYQGSTLRKPFVWQANNVPVDITGYTGRCQFRPTLDSDIVALNLTTLNGGVLIDGPTGTITLYASDAQTAALTLDKYVYDLEIVDTVGDVSRLVFGTVTLSKEITR
jgi:hypothetical protein